MSFVTVVPEHIGHAAGQLENIGSALTAANAAAGGPDHQRGGRCGR